MQGMLRNRSRAQSQHHPAYAQDKWGGGQNTDDPASKIAANELAGLTNVIDFGDYLEGHSGSLRIASTALPGSGTVYALDFHPTAKKLILHRGTGVYTAGPTVASWTQVSGYAKPFVGPTSDAGDSGNQLSAEAFGFFNSSNTNAGVLYWSLTNSGSTRTLSIYKDSAKLNLVAQGSRTGDGQIILLSQNSSGLMGIASVVYSGDDTDAANTYTLNMNDSAFTNANSKLRMFGADAVLSVTDTDPSGRHGIYYINLTDDKYYILNATPPRQVLTGTGSQAAATPYGYRYIFTYCRIVSVAGAFDPTKTRVTGTLLAETGGRSLIGGSGTPAADSTDYGEFWLASAISGSNAHSLVVNTTSAIVQNGDGSTCGHFTHIGLYRTLDIGAAGVDPKTGLGNNREIFAWVGDYPIGSGTLSITKTDDELRAGFAKGFALKSRFFVPVQNGEVFLITPGFLFVGRRGYGDVHYSQLLNKELAGQYRQDVQFFKFEDGIQFIEDSNEEVSMICSKETWRVNPKLTKNNDSIASVFTLTQRLPASKTIGVTDWGSIAKVEGGGLIARCSDASIRVWNGRAWGPDLADSRVRKTSQNMIDGSAGAYTKNAYYLWYRTASSDAYNTKCLRLGLGGDAGFGWSAISRSTWIFPHLRVAGAVMLDSANLARLIILDQPTGTMFWIETFTNAESSLTQAWLDKENVSGGTNIACTIKLREFIGSQENHTLHHKESHCFFRPVVVADGYLSGFAVGYNIYADGSTTAAAATDAAPRDGDVQLSKVAKGRRLQPEITTNRSKFQLTGWNAEITEQDKATIGNQFGDTAEAGYQLELASNLKHWLCRPETLLNRATGESYTLAGTAPTQVTGPDGKTYALSFPSGASYTLADTTSYSDFAICFWCKTVALNSRIVLVDGANDFWVRFTSNTVMDVNGDGNVTVDTIASGFHNFWAVRSGSTVSVYQNGVLKGTVSVGTARGGIQVQVDDEGGAMILDDVRIYNALKSAAAIDYYYDDVINNSGNLVLPLA